MRIFDKDKKNELVLENLDLTKGYLKEDKLFLKKHKAVKEQIEEFEYVIIKEYPNGGKDVDKKIIKPYIAPKNEWEEYEDIQVYIEYTEKELAEKEILILSQNLTNTDYQAIKYGEGVLSEKEYLEIKTQREEWRNRINELKISTLGM